MLFVLLAIAFQVPSQPVDPSVYLSFFQAAIHRDAAVNSDQPSIGDALSITPTEADSLVQLAALCEGDICMLDARASALVFESRLQAAANDKPSEKVAAQLLELESKRTSIIEGYVQRMKASLTAEAFSRVTDYVRTHANGGYFPTSAVLKKL